MEIVKKKKEKKKEYNNSLSVRPKENEINELTDKEFKRVFLNSKQFNEIRKMI